MTRDLGVAEDLAQDALVQALEQWPRDGLPDNPGAWLMSTAKRRAVDYFRHNEVVRRKTAELGRDLEEVDMPDLIGGVDRIEDDVLRLIFLTCHPALPAEARAALTLRLVGGLTTSEIARGFLVKDATIGQRISRAKRTLAEVRADFELPSGSERVARLDDVMGVIYLIFNEGYAATTGPDWMRPDLCAEAIRLARMLAELMPGEPDVHGLQALLELQASRIPARVGPDGAPVLLEAQDRARWDQLLIRRGLAALARAEALGQTRRPLCHPGRDRRLSRPRRPRRGHRLGPDGQPVRPARSGRPQPGGRGQSGDRPRPRLRSGGRPADPRAARRGAGAGQLTAAGQRPRRSAGAGRPDRRGRGGVSGRRRPQPQRGRTHPAAAARRGEPLTLGPPRPS